MTDPSESGLPAETEVWVRAHAPRQVLAITPIGGGYTATKWIVSTTNGEPLVLRWSNPQRWGDTGREHVRREALACRLLAGSGLGVPRLVASDLTGADAGGPAVLLTWRPGGTRLERLSPDAVETLAGVTVSIHRRPVSTNDRPPPATFRGPVDPETPGWSRRPELWRRAIEIRNSEPPPTPPVLLHRDLHLGNMLWDGERVSGLIDWAELSYGPADLDVAHLCSDFAMLHSTADAVAFRRAYRQRGGVLDPDPDAARYWMVGDILGFLPDPAHILISVGKSRPDLTPEGIRGGLEALLALALDQAWS